MKHFFNRIAPQWDEMEIITEEVFMPLLQELDIHPGDKVLDIACGTGVISAHLQQLSGGKVLGIDLSEKMVEIAQQKHQSNGAIEFVCADFMEWAEEAGETRYDYAVLYNAYPHFLAPEKLSQQMGKVLKQGGRFAIVHSLSRTQLNAHHAQMEANGAGHFSRTLLPAERECQWFEQDYEILHTKDDESGYLIIGRKR